MRLSQEFRSYTLFCIAFGIALVAFSGCSDSGSETAGATSETTNGIAVIAFDGRTSLYRRHALRCTSVLVPSPWKARPKI